MKTNNISKNVKHAYRMTPTESHRYNHLENAESYYEYVYNFNFESDKKVLLDYKKRMWLELFYAAMSLKDFNSIKNLPDIVIHETVTDFLTLDEPQSDILDSD